MSPPRRRSTASGFAITANSSAAARDAHRIVSGLYARCRRRPGRCCRCAPSAMGHRGLGRRAGCSAAWSSYPANRGKLAECRCSSAARTPSASRRNAGGRFRCAEGAAILGADLALNDGRGPALVADQRLHHRPDCKNLALSSRCGRIAESSASSMASASEKMQAAEKVGDLSRRLDQPITTHTW